MNTEEKTTEVKTKRGNKRKIVHDLLKTGAPVTLEMLKEATGTSDIRSLGADIRAMRKFSHGSHVISSKRIGTSKNFVYQLLPKK